MSGKLEALIKAEIGRDDGREMPEVDEDQLDGGAYLIFSLRRQRELRQDGGCQRADRFARPRHLHRTTGIPCGMRPGDEVHDLPSAQ